MSRSTHTRRTAPALARPPGRAGEALVNEKNRCTGGARSAHAFLRPKHAARLDRLVETAGQEDWDSRKGCEYNSIVEDEDT